MGKPDFIIAGVARCGTTSLYYYLKQHPEIGFSAVKEPKYFSSTNIKLPHNGPGDATVDANVVLSPEQYYGLFAQAAKENKKRIGEASSDYLYYAESTAPMIKHALGDVQIIILLRNPAERAYSAYVNMLRDSRETLSFHAALEAEEDRLKDNWDWMWAYKLGGLYYEKLKIYMDSFKAVKVILLEDLERQPKETLRKIYAFLRVDDSFKAQTSIKYSKTGKPSNTFVKLLLDRSGVMTSIIRKGIITIMPRQHLEKIAAKVLVRSSMDQRDRDYLRSFYRSDIEKLENLLQRDLSAWK